MERWTTQTSCHQDKPEGVKTSETSARPKTSLLQDASVSGYGKGRGVLHTDFFKKWPDGTEGVIGASHDILYLAHSQLWESIR